jgi:hypothetical protein
VNRAFPYALAGVLAFAGCGTSNGSSPASPPAAAPAEAATPSAAGKTPMTRKTAAAYYLAAAKPYNAVYKPCVVIEEKAEMYDPEMQRALAACRKLPGAITAFIGKMEHPPAPWPAEVRGPIGDLVDSNRAFYYCAKQLRNARTVDDYFKAGEACPDQSDDHSAEIVRAHLGLPAAT